jgi:hypothetical protein
MVVIRGCRFSDEAQRHHRNTLIEQGEIRSTAHSNALNRGFFLAGIFPEKMILLANSSQGSLACEVPSNFGRAAV